MRWALILLVAQTYSYPLFSQTRSQVQSWIVKASQLVARDPQLCLQYLDSIGSYLQVHPEEKYFGGQFNKLKGAYYYRVGAYDSSIFHYNAAAFYFEELDSLLDQAKTKVNLAMTYNRLSDYDKTLSLATEALKLFEQLSDIKGIGISYNMIAQVYLLNRDFNNALINFRKYLKYTIDSLEQAGGYNNLGATFSEMNNLDSAMYYNKKALAIHLKLDNPYGIGNAYQNIGSNYDDLGEPQKALENYEKAIVSYQQVDNLSGILEVTINIGRVYSNLQKWYEAIAHLEKAQNLAGELDERYNEQQALSSLSLAYEKTGQYAKALQAQKQLKTVSDSIYNTETRANIEEISVKYETEKKNQQIALLNTNAELQKATIQKNTILIVSLIALVITLLMLFLLWKNRLGMKQKAILQEQKMRYREAQINAVLESQEKERRRFASDLHDGLGQLLTTLQHNINAIRNTQSLDKKHELVENSEQILDDIQNEIRNTAFNLMPPVLVKEGLVAAISELARKIEKARQVSIEVYAHEMSQRCDSLVEISIYRITQETVSNILKYSKADRITISLTGFDGHVNIMIEDDGEGFDVVSFKKSSTGNGWSNIQSRLQLINGKIEYDSHPGKRGTSVTLEFPWHSTKKEVTEIENT